MLAESYETINHNHFGVTIGVAAFQRVTDCFTQQHRLKKIYAYLDDLTVTRATLEKHDRNFKALLDAAVSDGLTFYEEMSKIGLQEIDFLGYRVSHNVMKPDPDRLRPLLDMPPPRTPQLIETRQLPS